MNMYINEELINKLSKNGDSIDKRLQELERTLSQDTADTKKEIIELLEKREKIDQYFEFLSEIWEIEKDTEARAEELKREGKERKKINTLNRINRVESMIMDYKMGAKRTKGTSIAASYIDNVHYFQKQLSSLVSSLE